jgi:hypothetical protein
MKQQLEGLDKFRAKYYESFKRIITKNVPAFEESFNAKFSNSKPSHLNYRK